MTVSAQVDTACDYVVLEAHVASGLGLALPFARQAGVSAAGGTQAATFSFAPDGLVLLFVTIPSKLFAEFHRTKRVVCSPAVQPLLAQLGRPAPQHLSRIDGLTLRVRILARGG